MAEHIKRPTTAEPIAKYSKRLAAMGVPIFDAAKCLADALAEDFEGTRLDPQKHLAVHVRDGRLVVQCLSLRATSWLRSRLGKRGLDSFAGHGLEVTS